MTLEISTLLGANGGASGSPRPMPAGYVVREFTIDDYDRAVALWRSCEGVGLNESDTPDGIARFIARNPGLSLVIEDTTGTLAAAVLCGHDGRRGYLHHLAVAPQHRRRGIGHALVHLCLERLRQRGLAKCSIFLYATNHSGRAFWETHGWTARADLLVLQKATS